MQWSRYISIAIVLFSVQLFCEEQGTGYLEAGLFTDYNNTNARDFIVKAVSPVWNRDCYLTDSFKVGSLFQIPEHPWQTSQGTFYKYGWDHCTSPLASRNSVNFDTLGYALYKISCTMDTVNCYFYLDWRDDRYPLVGGNDFEINFDDTMSYSRFSCADYGDNPLNWIKLGKGDTIGIWEILDFASNPSRDRFQPTNPTGLTVTEVNNHPKLTWNESSAPPAVPKYHVYRCSESVYHCIASYLDTNTYTDDNVTFNKFGETYHYKVRAVSGDSSILSPGYSNVVTFLGDGPIEKKTAGESVNEQADYFPVKIFPNPFNRTVRIQFQLSSDKLYNTEIYDLSGHCVWDHSFTSQKGEYAFSWNGSGGSGDILPSGIYFLIVKSGSRPIFREKLMYLK